MPDKHNERLSLLPPPCSWSDLFGSQTRPNPFSKTFNRCRCPRHPVDKFSFTQVVFGHQTGLRTTLPPQPGWAAFAPPTPPPPPLPEPTVPFFPARAKGPRTALEGRFPHARPPPRDFVFSAVPGRGLETRSAAGRSADGQPPSGPRVPLGSRPVPDPALSRTPRVSPGPTAVHSASSAARVLADATQPRKDPRRAARPKA